MEDTFLYALVGQRAHELCRSRLSCVLALLRIFVLALVDLARLSCSCLRRHPLIYDGNSLARDGSAIGMRGFAPVCGLDSNRPGADQVAGQAMKISATIITFNEERNVPRVIESLRCCDEILVLDSGSNDRTGRNCDQLGARVEEASWHGYAAQKNIAAELATHDWILSLDADESLSEALEAEIWHIKKSGPQFDGYTMPRLAQYLGRWILHSGWYPDSKVRLFDRRKAKWVGAICTRNRHGVSGAVGHLKSNSASLHVQFIVGASPHDGQLHHARCPRIGLAR